MSYFNMVCDSCGREVLRVSKKTRKNAQKVLTSIKI